MLLPLRKHLGPFSDIWHATTPPPPLEPATAAGVFRITSDININKSSGLSNVHTRVIKASLLALNNQFTHIINTSFNTHKILRDWKKAKVIPIPKIGALTDINNYRPISLLPTPGKVIDKLVHRQIEDYLEDSELLTTNQHGFRRDRSTAHAITQLLNHINHNLNNRIPTLAIFIDFQKAFDCLRYPTLLAKLTTLGLGNDIVSWIRDYLSERSQATFANGKSSEPGSIKQGVPQGSILGPLLYILYANDLSRVFCESNFAFYADDTVLYPSNKDIAVATGIIQRDLDRLQAWCDHNCIFVNPQKTKCMLFSAKEIVCNPIQITVKGEVVERVAKFKYLGVVLDQHLTFDNHAKYIIDRVAAKVYQFRKLKKFLTNKAALMVYKNMILPIMEYGDIYLVSATKENRIKLQRLQNRALKCALDKQRDYNIRELHREAKLDKLRLRRKIHILQHMYKLSCMPDFPGWKRATGIRTRSSKKKLMEIRKPNLTKFQRSLTYVGPKTWSSLPKDIQQADNFWAFKGKLASHFPKSWLPLDEPV